MRMLHPCLRPYTAFIRISSEFNHPPVSPDGTDLPRQCRAAQQSMGIRVDSKRRKKLMQKRLAMGHKQDDHEQITVKHYNNRRCILAQYIEFTQNKKNAPRPLTSKNFFSGKAKSSSNPDGKSGLASDHSITVRGCEVVRSCLERGRPRGQLCTKILRQSYVEAMSMLLGESMEPVYPQAKKQEQAD